MPRDDRYDSDRPERSTRPTLLAKFTRSHVEAVSLEPSREPTRIPTATESEEAHTMRKEESTLTENTRANDTAFGVTMYPFRGIVDIKKPSPPKRGGRG